jgi:hypothetical protein
LILTNSIFGISYRPIYTNPQINCSIYSIDAAAHHSIVQLFGSFAGIKKGVPRLVAEAACGHYRGPFSAMYCLWNMQGCHDLQMSLADCKCGAFAA